MTDISSTLRAEFESRSSRNPRYSLRAFARDLGISPPRLSRILSGERGLSKTAAEAIALRLGLTPHEAERFSKVAEAHHGRAKRAQKAARDWLRKTAVPYRDIDERTFRIVSEWYHFGILALLETEKLAHDPVRVARRLGINIIQAEEAIQRLLQNGMIEKRGKHLHATGLFFANAGGVPSRSVRNFHDQLLEKARAALSTQPVEERDFCSLVVAFDPEEMASARTFIREFREEFERRFCQNLRSKSEVMALGVQFFKLSVPAGEEK